MTAPIPWEQMTHEQLHTAVNTGPGPGVSMAAEQTWRAVHEIIEAGEARMNAAATGSGEGWQGAAGDAARSGFHQLNSWARDAAMDAHNTAAAMVEQAVSAGRLRSNLPAPNTEQLVTAQDAARNAFDKPAWDALQEAEAEATWRDESARRAMMQYHFHSGDNRQLMDYWAVPPTVLVEAGPLSGPSASGAGGFGGGAGQAYTGPGPAGVVPDGAGGAGTAGAGSASGPGASTPGGTTAGGPGGAGSAGPGASGPGSMGTGGIGAALSPGASAAGAGGAGAGGAGRAGTTSPGRPGAVASGGGGAGSSIRGPKDLPAGTGGRGSRPPGAAGSSPGSGIRPVAPRVAVPAAPSPTWRDVVAANRGEAPGVGGRPGDGASGLRGPGGAGPGGGGSGGPLGGGPGGGGPGGGASGGGTGSGSGAGLRGPVEAGGRTGAGGHGMYPPMGGGGVGNQGEDRRRASYLVDDTGAFDVDLPCVEPVIGANIPSTTTRTRGDAGT